MIDRDDILDRVKFVSKRIYGDNLHSLYLTNDANSVLNITCVIKDYGATEPLSEDAQELVNSLISFVEFELISLKDISYEKIIWLKNNCNLILGKEFIDVKDLSLEEILDSGMSLDKIDDQFYHYASYGLTGIPSDDERKGLCRWISRNVLRTAYSIVMLREKKYVTDLESCYMGYSKYYPESSDLIKEFLNLFNNPIIDLEELSEKWTDVKDLLEGQFEDRTLD
tara:strand:- start:288 stop:962 length:675 start_codon:yes stop_codon:yes gene_type:complete